MFMRKTSYLYLCIMLLIISTSFFAFLFSEKQKEVRSLQKQLYDFDQKLRQANAEVVKQKRYAESSQSALNKYLSGEVHTGIPNHNVKTSSISPARMEELEKMIKDYSKGKNPNYNLYQDDGSDTDKY